MPINNKNLWQLVALIVAVSAVLAGVAADSNVLAGLIGTRPKAGGPLSIETALVQQKVLSGSDGQVAVSLTVGAAEIGPSDRVPVRHADMVIVLDRSGSMEGQKIRDARQAVLRFIERLTDQDRLALVAYSNSASVVFPLAAMDDAHRSLARKAIEEIAAGGGTNLGGGLQLGIEALTRVPSGGRQRRVVLISDGLANQGITDPRSLGNMAAGAVEQHYTVSTVGVGYDFNEGLMTAIADHGAGRYTFLENPDSFSRVFEKEFESARLVAASGLELRVPLHGGLQLLQAGGFPIRVQDGAAVIRLGDLTSGERRTLFLTYKVPTDREREIALGAIEVRYRFNDTPYSLSSRQDLTLACVADQKEVLSSIDQSAWGDHVVQEEYGRLKDELAAAVRKGEKEAALERIDAYEARNRTINAAVGSDKVAGNLDQQVQSLRQSVEATFAGAPSAVAEKSRQASKALQYESYQMRRDKK